MRILVPGLRSGARVWLAAAVLAALPWTSASGAPPAAPPAPPAAPPAAAPAPRPADGIHPPDGKWLVDEHGHKYYLGKFPKAKGSYLKINDHEVRTSWGITLHVAKEDDKFFYYRIYKPEEHPVVASARPAPPSAAELAKAAATYKPEIPESDRLRFLPFGKGLPTSGQWRNGFDIADMNQDGHPDIVSGPARKSLGNPAIFLGDGKGNWTRWSGLKFPRVAFDYGDAAVGDFNGDGHPDIALGMHLRGLQVLLGDGKGGFTNASEGLDFSVPGHGDEVPGFSSQALLVTDWNGDGRPDIVALGEGPTLAVTTARVRAPGSAQSLGLVVYLNQGDGKWKRQDEGTGGGHIFGDSLALGDFDGDRRIDLATSSGVMGRKDLVNLHQADGSWQPEDVDTLRPGAYVNAVAAADLDRDGRTDLVVGYVNFELEVWRSGIDVYYSRQGGKWERRTLWAEEGRDSVTAAATGDLDGDGNLDVVALTGDGRILVFLGDGKGSFTREKAGIPAPFHGCRGYHVQLADLDGDHRDEVVASFAGEATGMSLPNGQVVAPEQPCPSGGGIAAWKVVPAAGRH